MDRHPVSARPDIIQGRQRNLSQTPTLQYTVAGDIILTRYS